MKTKIEKGYHDNGKLWYEAPYVNGKKHGVENGWYSNGDPKYEIPWINGEIHGIEKWWGWDDGKPECEIPWVNGKKHGIKKQWDCNRKLTEYYYLDNEEVTCKEYRRRQIILILAGVK